MKRAVPRAIAVAVTGAALAVVGLAAPASAATRWGSRAAAARWGSVRPPAATTGWGRARPPRQVATSVQPPAAGPPSKPLRVELWGDSLAWQAAGSWTALMRATGHAVVRTRTFGGTALCDWLGDIRRDLDPSNRSGFHPQVAVLEFSGNAFTACMQQHGRPLTGAALVAKYHADALEAIRIFRDTGTTVYFAGGPITAADAGRYTGRTPLDSMYAALPAGYAGFVRYADAATPLEWHGTFTWTLPCAHGETCTGHWPDGTPTVVVRQADGTHFCPIPVRVVKGVPDACPVYSPGAARFAAALSDPVIADYHLR